MIILIVSLILISLGCLGAYYRYVYKANFSTKKDTLQLAAITTSDSYCKWTRLPADAIAKLKEADDERVRQLLASKVKPPLDKERPMFVTRGFMGKNSDLMGDKK